ncbi:stage II sporulation protein M [Clostridium malenominatum]|uniref:Stage II sporulation protein M n=1 Tax=Clostridium malenominatum TaxID=1539 RepID=A0ABN1IXV1_9CLOT
MFGRKISEVINKHIGRNIALYIITLVCIFAGILIGMYSVRHMGEVYKSELINYLNSFMDYLLKQNVNYKGVLFQAISNNIPFLLFIWFLGMTIIGVPLIVLINLIKGYTLGFTISFIVDSTGGKGIIMCLLGILPQNLFYLPCIIIASVISMEFSLHFLKEKMNRRYKDTLAGRIVSYSLCYLIIILFMGIGFVFEAYVTPNILKLVI